MNSIDGIEIYPIISLVLFTTFFGVVLWKVISMRKSEISILENTPFDE
jgi:hypothetical protein